MEPPIALDVGEVRVEKEEIGYVAYYKASDGFIYFIVTELTQSRQSIDVVLEIEIVRITGPLPTTVHRIDLRSASAIRSLVTDLNNSYGGKKDTNGFNWALILNTVVSELSKKIKQSQTVVNLADVPFEEPSFLLAPFLQQDAPNLIFAQSEVGKTFFVQRMALSLASGIDFLGFASPTGKKILYLDYEDSPSAFASRLHKLCKGMGLEYKTITPHLLYYKPGGSFRNNVEIVRRMIQLHSIDLLVIDAGGDASGGSPSDEEKVIDLFNALEEIKCTKLMLHHEPKYIQNEASAFYGSMYWKARSRVAWRLELESEDTTSKLVKLTIQKKSNLPPQPTLYYRQRFLGVSLDEVFDGPVQTHIPAITLELETAQGIAIKKNTEEGAIEAIEKHGELSTLNLQEILGRERSVVTKKLLDLESKGVVERVKKGRSFLWRLKL